ncbi:MAG: hypothetical protein QOD58_2536 [Mycobacterium sp.]|nr:hypothetical protein [Mycobacterium sp.]
MPATTSTPAVATTPAVTTTPTVTGTTASIVVKVDCGPDGAAHVTVAYGTAPPEEVVVGSGGAPTFRGRYGTMPGFADSNLTVTTRPTRGTCKTTLTDHGSGDIIASSESSTDATLTAVVSTGQ